MARREAADVTETELAMLRVLWERDEATRRQVTDTLYPNGGEAHYATVQKLLERLETKGFVRRERRENVLVFTATLSRDDYLCRRLQSLADQLCGGSVAPLVMNLVRSQPLSAAELEELDNILRQRHGPKSRGNSR